MKLVAYARVSTNDQNLDGQIDSIQKYCDYHNHTFTLFSEKASAISEREEFKKAIDEVKKDGYDGFIVTDLDRLGRSVLQLVVVYKDLQDFKRELIIISKNLDTSTKEGRLQFNILSSFAQFEREQIRERLLAGQRRTGRYGGRVKKELPKSAIVRSYRNGASYEYIAKLYSISKSILSRRLREWGELDLKDGKRKEAIPDEREASVL